MLVYGTDVRIVWPRNGCAGIPFYVRIDRLPVRTDALKPGSRASLKGARRAGNWWRKEDDYPA